MSDRVARLRRKARTSIYYASLPSFLLFVNDGRATYNGPTLDPATYNGLTLDAFGSPEAADLRTRVREVLDALPLVMSQVGGELASWNEDLRWAVSGRARLTPLEQKIVVEIERNRETFNALLFCQRLIDYYLLAPDVEAYRLLGRCAREWCRRWFVENRVHQIYCRTPECLLRAERARVQSSRSLR